MLSVNKLTYQLTHRLAENEKGISHILSVNLDTINRVRDSKKDGRSNSAKINFKEWLY